MSQAYAVPKDSPARRPSSPKSSATSAPAIARAPPLRTSVSSGSPRPPGSFRRHQYAHETPNETNAAATT